MVVYLDTSAFLKYYRKEKGTAQVSGIIREGEKGRYRLISSIWIVPESVAGIQSWLMKGWITKGDRNKLLGRLSTDLDVWSKTNTIRLEEISVSLLSHTTVLIAEHSLTPGDSLHLATALSWKPEIDFFVTSDRQLKKSAEKENLSTFDPEKEIVDHVDF